MAAAQRFEEATMLEFLISAAELTCLAACFYAAWLINRGYRLDTHFSSRRGRISTEPHEDALPHTPPSDHYS